MAWIESNQELARHPKVNELAEALGVSRPTAIGHLHLLWWWALDFAEDGNLSRWKPRQIANGAEWDGAPDVFMDALVSARFVDLTADGGMVLHDWEEYVGRLLEQRRANAARQRAYRERRSRHNAHVTVTSPSRNAATGPDRTGPNRTGPDHDGGPLGAPAPAARAPAHLRVIDAPATGARRPARAPVPDGLARAFTDLGLSAPATLPGDELAAVNELLQEASADDVAACWQDVATGAWPPNGDGWERARLSFSLLNRQNRFGQWRTWKASQPKASQYADVEELALAYWDRKRAEGETRGS